MRKTLKHLRKIKVFEGSRGSEKTPKEGPDPLVRRKMRPRWLQVDLKLGQDELR